MTLPEFAYPLQGRYGDPNYCENLAKRIINKERTMQVQVEVTDTFGGEANYGWVRRYEVEVPEGASNRSIVRKVKKEIGYTGVRCQTTDYGDTITLDPVGCCERVFITFWA